jgi:hypothetical protein
MSVGWPPKLMGVEVAETIPTAKVTRAISCVP